MRKLLQHKIILPLVVLLAIAIVVYQIKNMPPPLHQQLGYPLKTVQVMPVQLIDYRSHVRGYGTVKPRIIVKPKAEVSGKIVFIHPDLRKGAILPAGTTVLKIEPTTFEFSLRQSQAGLSSNESSLLQLQTEEENTRALLKIVRRNLKVQLKEYQRLQKLWDDRLVSRSDVDTGEQKVLQLKQQVADLQGKLKTYGSRKAALKAQIEQARSQVAQTRDTLGRTEIKMPIDARIGQVMVEKGEFTSAGAVLFEALGTQAVEITAELPTRLFRPLLASQQKKQLNLSSADEFLALLKQLDLQVRVKLVGYPEVASWQGSLLRIGETIDPLRDTIALVVEVKQPYANVIPGERPPLLNGMFAEVIFYAHGEKRMVIPRQALHQGRVYLADKNNRLEIRPVETLYQQGNYVVIKSGLEKGERLILGDIVPVIQGMPLNPVWAQAFHEQFVLRAAARK